MPGTIQTTSVLMLWSHKWPEYFFLCVNFYLFIFTKRNWLKVVWEPFEPSLFFLCCKLVWSHQLVQFWKICMNVLHWRVWFYGCQPNITSWNSKCAKNRVWVRCLSVVSVPDSSILSCWKGWPKQSQFKLMNW